MDTALTRPPSLQEKGIEFKPLLSSLESNITRKKKHLANLFQWSRHVGNAAQHTSVELTQ